MFAQINTLAGRTITIERHTGGCYAITGPNVTGYRFHGGDALRVAQDAATRDVPADVLVSRIPRGPIVRSALMPDAGRHTRERFPSAHRDTVRGVVETIVLQGDPPGERDSRYSDARYRAIARRADAERTYLRAFTLARCDGRLPYCDPVTTEHRIALETLAAMGGTRAASQTGDSTARRRAHDARKRSDADSGADAELLALRAAAARAAGGADALSFRMAPAPTIPLAAHPTR